MLTQSSAQHNPQSLRSLPNRLHTDPETALSARSGANGKIRGKKLYGRVWKLSNYGYSQHERLLILNKKGLSYYREVPEDFKDQ